jgi:predicted esterase
MFAIELARDPLRENLHARERLRTQSFRQSLRAMSLKSVLLLSGLCLLTACSSDDSSSDGTQNPQTPAPNVPQPAAEFVPKPTGTCPGFAEGAGCTKDDVSLICTFSPATIVPRPVRIWMSDAARKKPGPLVTFWHGLSRNAGDAILALAGLGPDVVNDIVAKGGIVAAPERSEKRMTTSFSELPWLLAIGAGDQDDLLVMDEVVACAHEEVGIDLRHIHTSGMSAGGLQTGAITPRRSGYLASTVAFSGGQIEAGLMEQDPENNYAMMLFFGGPNDMVVLNFRDTQTQFHARLKENGHYALLCDHNSGHTVPAEAAMAGWEFMQAHPFGVTPEPWANALPASIPSYCTP